QVSQIKLHLDLYEKGKLVKKNYAVFDTFVNEIVDTSISKEDDEKGIKRVEYLFFKYIHQSDTKQNIYSIQRIIGENRQELDLKNTTDSSYYPHSEPLIRHLFLEFNKPVNIMIMTFNRTPEKSDAQIFRYKGNPTKFPEFNLIEKSFIVSVEITK
ncbi:MAG: hypothetical protein LBD38_05635, partial [Streptococcaceae bacterium]|nr:hypothetical protein [Streptococcaceae bacterium]